jgi:ATP-dependent RNA helicase DDX52/ROK1
MDPFRSLSVGLTFDKAVHGDDMKRFLPNNSKGRGVPSGAASGLRDGVALDTIQSQVATTSSSSSKSVSAIAVPALPSSLQLFKKSNFGEDAVDSDTEGDSASPSGGDQTSSSSGPANAPTTISRHTPLKEMSRKHMINIWRKHALTVKGSDIPSPVEHFSSLVRPPLNVPEHVVNNLFTRAHRVPTPVQMQAIPALIRKRDVLACAPTGSGKTLAFLIPMFALLKQPDPNSVGVRGLVISPTMELAVQIEREAFFLLKGGNRWKLVQHGQSTKGKDICVSTPGRLASLIKQKLIDLSQVELLVFDEGDKLWDDRTDFLPVVDTIIAACSNPNKVVALFTATMSERVEANAMSVMHPDPVRIIVQGRTSANKDVEQRLVFCTNELGKVVAVRNFIREGIRPPVLIFVQSIERTKELFDEIKCHVLHVALIHSRMTSDERDDIVLNFRLGKIWVLITTELLSRGIDFKGIGTVINFDIPLTPESYVHRVGRTGRAGKKGLAVTFFTTDDYERLAPIAKIAKESGANIEDWMLELKVNKKRERELSSKTPLRMIVNTEKRIMVGLQRTDRRLRAAEREKEAEKGKKKGAKGKRATDDDDEDDDDDFEDEE